MITGFFFRGVGLGLKKPWLKLAQAEFLSLLVYATAEANLYMEVQQGPHSIQGVYNAVQCTPTL